MVACRFCHRRFRNGQAVKGHLRSCAEYKQVEPKAQPARAGSKAEPKADDTRQPARRGSVFDPAHHARQDLEHQRARLELRRINAAHAELDAQEAARKVDTRARQDEARAREQAAERAAREEVEVCELARGRVEKEVEAQRRREQVEEDRKKRRRDTIERAKALTGWGHRVRFGLELGKPANSARVTREFEEAFAGLPAEDLAWGDVVARAEDAWTRVCQPLAMAKAEEERLQAEDRRRQEEEAGQRRQAHEAARAETDRRVRATIDGWNRQPHLQRLAPLGEAAVREVLGWSRRFGRLSSVEQQQKVAQVVAKLRPRLEALPAAELAAMTATGVRTLVQAIEDGE